MGSLLGRISRLVRAELNSSQGDDETTYLNQGTALVTAGTATGASLGKVGILAGGTGYSVGAVPLAAAGALTGAALYEALRSLTEGDASSVNSVAIGAATGAATSMAIGGVGVSVGGSAIGVGVAAMAAGGAVAGLGLAGLYHLFQQGIDPDKLLDAVIEQMETDLQNARRAMINVVASQKRLQQQCEQTQAEIHRWQQRVQLAQQRGDTYLAQQALKREKLLSKMLGDLQEHLSPKLSSVGNLKQTLGLLESKLSEAKAMRSTLKARIAAAKATWQLQNTVAQMETNNALATLKRIEEDVLQSEARSQMTADLTGADLAHTFAILEPDATVDEELAVMKAQLLGADQSSPHRSASESANVCPSPSAIDLELEILKRMVDQL